MRKKVLSILLSICILLNIGPIMTFADDVNAGQEVGVTAYATKEQLMSEFMPDTNGVLANTGKIIFGKNSDAEPQEWYILGKDNSVDGDNVAIFAASALVKDISFESSLFNKTDASLWSDCVYADGSTPSEVFSNHYGSSNLRRTLKEYAADTDNFSTSEQGIMNATTVSVYDYNNAENYTVSDKLYALQGAQYDNCLKVGGNDNFSLYSDYWIENSDFWLRTPFSSSESVLMMKSESYVSDYTVTASFGEDNAHPNAQPAANLNLTTAVFASAVPATTEQALKYGTLADGTAMSLRLDGKDMSIGSVLYNPNCEIIKAVKGETSEPVRLVVQGFDGTNNWYYSKQIDSATFISAEKIKLVLNLSGNIDLSLCKIWLEVTTDNLTYAVNAVESDFAPTGDGSAENPYQIGNVEELYGFAQIVNSGNTDANAILTADITVNSNLIYAVGGELAADPDTLVVWKPIGSTDNPYTGMFDGNNCTVSGLYLDSEINIAGLFGWNRGTIKNVGVTDSYISGSNSVGGVCGFNQGGTVSGCFNTGTVKGSRHVGGVCGWSDGTVIGCDNTGKVLGEENVGGVCGYNSGKIVAVYNRGTVAGDAVSGAVCGINTKDGTLTECYYIDGSNESGIGSNSGTGTACAYSSSAFKDGTLCAALNQILYTEGSDVRFYQGATAPEFIYAPKLVDGVYQIGSAVELFGFARLVNQGELSANAVLTADIVVNIGDVASCDGVNDKGWVVWTPIGGSSGTYSGDFDGRNYTVSGLYFNDSNTKYVGLFGQNNGNISNVGVINSYFYGDCNIGGICGYNSWGTIENSYNNGTVKGNFLVGGVCANNNYGKIKNSYNNGNVTGVTSWLGGVCGRNSGANKTDAVIINCYNSGSINGGDIHVGGVCGENYCGSVSNSYFNDSAYDGNAVGTNNGGDVTAAEGKNAAEFNNGAVAYLLQNGEGGEVWGQDLSLSNSYPVLDSTKKVYYVSVIYCDNTTGTGYSNTNATLKGVHKYEYSNGFCAGCAKAYQEADFNSAKNRYEISNAGQLYWFADFVNSGNNSANAILLNDIIVNENLFDKLNADGTVKDGCTVKSWTPIGNGDKSYYGYFDGAGHTVSGIYINSSGTDTVGLFGTVRSKGISNLGVINSYICGSGYAGAVCAISYAPLENCYASGTVKGGSNVGGICGGLDSDYGSSGSMSSCSFSGSVSGNSNVGGVCGINNCTIKNCFNTGTVNGNSKVGGFVGYNSGTVENAYNIGTVGGTENFGGVCGSNGGTINNCYYNGDTFGGEAVGVDYNGTLTNTERKTTSEFNNGSVAYLLSTGTDGSVWGQDLSVANSYPSFNANKKVYRNSVYAGCVGNPGEPTGVIYTNTNKDVYADHVDNNNDGVCDNGCGQYFRAVVYEVSATLNGDIGLNYYIGLPQSVTGDKNAYVKLSVNSATYKLPVSEASTQNGLYKFTVWLSAKEMRDDVTFALYDGNGSLVDIYSRKGTKLEGSTFNYTLEKYFNAISSTDNRELKNLAEATLTYGAYAQNAFNHNPDASYDGTELSAVTAEVLEKYKMTKSAEIPSGLTLTEVTLILNTRTAFRLYFKSDNIDAYSFVLDGNEVKPSYIAEENLYYIELPDIHAKELDTAHTLTVNNECDISFSALSYAYAVIKADKDTDIVNVCKALYLYNEAANAYFTNNQ